MSDPNPPVQGLVAGKYELLRLIGRGGMGSVWEGRHTSLRTHVAIKFVDHEYADSPEARSRFVTEARAAATIQSKYAIQIFDHGLTDDGRPYIVMELLTGEALDRRLARLGRLSLVETARVLGQVCRALQRAHDAGIIHRDLKPENIFLVRSPDDDDEIAKVLDFGIAKFRAPPGSTSLTSSTKTGAVLGTPFYMSPEQARGLRNIDHRTDLWSLGVIAYKCVVGVLPFDGESVGDLLVKICTNPLPVPSRAALDLPPAFDAWFSRSLEREPQRRFASASELSEALALTAGISQPRASSGRQPEARLPLPIETPAEPLPTATATSAPITTQAMSVRPPRRVWLGVAVAALTGGTLGVIGVVKLVGPSAPTVNASSGSEPPPTASLSAPTAPSAEAASSDASSFPMESAPHKPGGATDLGARASTAPSMHTAVKPTTATLASSAPKPVTAPPPASPSPKLPLPGTKATSADPGY